MGKDIRDPDEVDASADFCRRSRNLWGDSLGESFQIRKGAAGQLWICSMASGWAQEHGEPHTLGSGFSLHLGGDRDEEVTPSLGDTA